MGKPGAEVNRGRAKLLELVSLHLERLGRTALGALREGRAAECLRTFQTERGPTKTVKAASLLPMAALFRMGLPAMARARAGCRPPRNSRTPQEQHRESQVEHTVRHRSLARCRHSPEHLPRLWSLMRPGAAVGNPRTPSCAGPDVAFFARGSRRWLKTAPPRSSPRVWRASNSALAAMEARAKGRFEAETEPETESAEEASIDRVTRRRWWTRRWRRSRFRAQASARISRRRRFGFSRDTPISSRALPG